jgi:hypothetical protein
MRAKEFIFEKVGFDTDNIRLVRVQPDLNGIGHDQHGIFIYRYGDSDRNTIHFVVNGVVAGHEMGNWDNAVVAIIANPKEIKAPMSGARLEDTWYNVDKDGKLYIGKAVILVPQGMDNPNKLPIEFYSGDRNQAVFQYLQSQGIDPLDIGRNSVAELDMTDYSDTVNDIIMKYGAAGETTQDQHFNTFDSHLEGSVKRLSLALKSAKTESYRFTNNQSVEVNYTDWVRETITDIIKQLDDYIRKNPKIAAHASAYHQKVRSQLQQLAKQSQEIDKRYENSGFLLIVPGQKTQGPMSWDQLSNQVIRYQQLYPGSPQQLHVARNWPNNGQPYDLLDSTAAEIFNKELAPYMKTTPPPLPTNNATVDKK